MVRTDNIEVTTCLEGGYEVSFRLIVNFEGLCSTAPFGDLKINGESITPDWGREMSRNERYKEITIRAELCPELSFEHWCKVAFKEIHSAARFVTDQSWSLWEMDREGVISAGKTCTVKVPPPLIED